MSDDTKSAAVLDARAKDAEAVTGWWAGYRAARLGDPVPDTTADTNATQDGYARGLRDQSCSGKELERLRKHDWMDEVCRRFGSAAGKGQADAAATTAARVEAEETTRAAGPAADNPLSVVCPQCHAALGERCRNYKGQNCAPHRQRGESAKKLAALDATPPAAEPLAQAG